jgi:hypothetical protein
MFDKEQVDLEDLMAEFYLTGDRDLSLLWIISSYPRLIGKYIWLNTLDNEHQL